MSGTYVLMPSPLLGAGCWNPVAESLRRRGATSLTVDVPTSATTPDAVLDAFVEAVPAGAEAILVPHSNAGLYAPAVAAAVDARAIVFVDAATPPEPGQAALAPPSMYASLEDRADADGLLPPWTQWWDAADVDDLFPSAESRHRVEATQPRLPLSYFASTVPVPDEWQSRPCAYLAFGGTYADDIARAKAAGWPFTELDGNHLHMLRDPDGVADEIVSLHQRLALRDFSD